MSKTPAPGTPAPSPPPPGPSGPTPTGPGPQRARGTGSPWPSRPQTPTSPSGPGRADDLMALANAVFELSPSEDDRAGALPLRSGAVPNVPAVRTRDDGRVDITGAVGAATFSLPVPLGPSRFDGDGPPRPGQPGPPPSPQPGPVPHPPPPLGVGPLYDALPKRS